MKTSRNIARGAREGAAGNGPASKSGVSRSVTLEFDLRRRGHTIKLTSCLADTREKSGCSCPSVRWSAALKREIQTPELGSEIESLLSEFWIFGWHGSRIGSSRGDRLAASRTGADSSCTSSKGSINRSGPGSNSIGATEADVPPRIWRGTSFSFDSRRLLQSLSGAELQRRRDRPFVRLSPAVDLHGLRIRRWGMERTMGKADERNFSRRRRKRLQKDS